MKLLLTALTVLFVALKLLDKIDWSWWLVFSPFLVGLALTLIAIFYVSYKVVDAQERRQKNLFRRK